MKYSEESLKLDIQAVNNISAVPGLLDVICKTTGMGFAVVARVTDERWIACSVNDNISFGMNSGDELKIETTLCHEVHQYQKAIIIDHVAEDEVYRDHHTPLMYGLQSYIAIPIYRRNGEFFGTLCAIDPSPNNLRRDEIKNLFTLFAELISFQLETELALLRSEENLDLKSKENRILEEKVVMRTELLTRQNTDLAKMNKELQSFAYISSHDLQEPLRKIQTFAGMLVDREINLTDQGKNSLLRMQKAAARMQSLINDLLSYSKSSIQEANFVVSDLNEIVKDVEVDFEDEFRQLNAQVIVGNLTKISIIPYQFRQLIYNMISNSLKFKHADRNPVINISGQVIERSTLADLKRETPYYKITVSDNGIGFNDDYSEKIFEVFQRLHDRSDYEGTGIGLSIVKKIAENHKGHITASSESGNGAVFELYLPLTESDYGMSNLN